MGSITNAPHVPRTRAFLDAGAMVRDPLKVFERYRNEMGPTFTVHMGGGRPAIVSADPAFVQHVLQKNGANYQMSDIRVRALRRKSLLLHHGASRLRHTDDG